MENLKKGRLNNGKTKDVGKMNGRNKNVCWIQEENQEAKIPHDFSRLKWKEIVNIQEENNTVHEAQTENVFFSRVVPDHIELNDYESMIEHVLFSRDDCPLEGIHENNPNKFWPIKETNDQCENNVDVDSFESVFVTVIPTKEHNSKECLRAKEDELEKWNTFSAYEEVDENGQDVISCRWVLVRKEDNVKARLCVRGFQENSKPQSDSPTSSKEVTKIV